VAVIPTADTPFDQIKIHEATIMDKATDLALVMITVAGAILTLVARKIGRAKNRNARGTNCSSNCGCIKSSAPLTTTLHPITPSVAGEPRKGR
jgi:hypothetical protein